MDHRTGAVLDDKASGLDRAGKTRGRTGLAKRHGGGLDAAYSTGADQEISLKAELRHTDQMQVFGTAADQAADDCQCAA